jgi:putative ABC transport system permease protein
VNALLLRPLPYAESDRLVLLSEKSSKADRLEVAYPNFADWRGRAQSFEGMAATYTANFSLTGVEKSARLEARIVNGNFFQLLGMRPQLGRRFAESDDQYGASRTAMISHELWQTQFGGNTMVIGQSIRLDDDLYTLIGVLPSGFEYFQPADVYVPIGLFLAHDSPLLNAQILLTFMPWRNLSLV